MRFGGIALALVLCGAGGCGGVEQPSSEAGVARDAGTDAPLEATCGQDPQVCSWVVYRTGCFEATASGTFCDFVATPCVEPPIDCAALGDLLGAPVSTQACTSGSSCIWQWSGPVDSAVLDQLCAMHVKAGASVDCMQN